MSEINSIANGTFTIGQTSATNFQAGPGIKIDEPTAGTVRIGNDETVLYSGALTSAANLYESLTHFERIKILYAIDGKIWHEFNGENGFNRDCFFGGGTQAQSWFGNIYLTFNNTSITIPTAYCYFLTGANITYNTGFNTYARNSIGAVIGINRISANNA